MPAGAKATESLKDGQMRIFFNVLIATFFWLGIFEPHLFVPLTVLPLTYVFASLTGADYVLWVFTFIAVVVLSDIVELLGRRSTPPAAPGSNATWRVRKRGDPIKRRMW